MPESVESLRCRGMRDRVPEEMWRFRRVERAFREACRSWGYEEVRTPTLEHLHLFTMTGTLSPQLLGRAYSFLDWDGWSGERVVLRPDATIPVGRLFLERMRERGTAKLFYVENIFRFAEGDAPREFWQCGAELLGATRPRGDLEQMLLGLEALERMGVGQASLVLSHPGVVRGLLDRTGIAAEEQSRLFDAVLAGSDEPRRAIAERLPALAPALGLVFDIEGTGPGYLANLRSALVGAIPELAPPLEELAVASEVLSRLGVEHRIANTWVRDFEYYTGLVFHFRLGDEVMGGGGRYDGLLRLMGGGDVPACGFGLDAERLMEVVAREGDRHPGEALALGAEEGTVDGLAAVFAAARALHRAGVPAEAAGGPGLDGAAARRITVSRDGSSFHFRDAATGIEADFESISSLVVAAQALQRGER